MVPALARDDAESARRQRRTSLHDDGRLVLDDEPQHLLREAVDVAPRSIADAVPVGSDIQHVIVGAERRREQWAVPAIDGAVLLVGDDDDPVGRALLRLDEVEAPA